LGWQGGRFVAQEVLPLRHPSRSGDAPVLTAPRQHRFPWRRGVLTVEVSAVRAGDFCAGMVVARELKLGVTA